MFNMCYFSKRLENLDYDRICVSNNCLRDEIMQVY